MRSGLATAMMPACTGLAVAADQYAVRGPRGRRLGAMMRLALAFAVLATPVPAQEDLVIDQTRIYASDPKACAAMEAKGIDAFMDSDFLALSFAEGIQSMEFHCNFYDIKSRPNTPLLFVDAVCEFPGALYPDILAIAPNGENAIRVVSGADTTLALAGKDTPPTDNPVGTTIYTRCDNLSEISVD